MQNAYHTCAEKKTSSRRQNLLRNEGSLCYKIVHNTRRNLCTKCGVAMAACTGPNLRAGKQFVKRFELEKFGFFWFLLFVERPSQTPNRTHPLSRPRSSRNMPTSSSDDTRTFATSPGTFSDLVGKTCGEFSTVALLVCF